MNQSMVYICEFCGTQYKDRVKASICEGSHKKPVKMQNAQYNPYTMDRSGCPAWIEIVMHDGTVKRYKRVSD